MSATEWKVRYDNPSGGKKVEAVYSSSTLLEQLMKKILDSKQDPKADQLDLVEELGKTLNVKEVLLTATPFALMETAFRLGYLYRVFLERNDVSIENSSSGEGISQQGNE